MQKLMKALHKNEKGFTLVELMVVVVIIAILIAIAIPIYGAVQERAERRACQANLRTIDGQAAIYNAMTASEQIAAGGFTGMFDSPPTHPRTETAYALDPTTSAVCPDGIADHTY